MEDDLNGDEMGDKLKEGNKLGVIVFTTYCNVQALERCTWKNLNGTRHQYLLYLHHIDYDDYDNLQRIIL